MDKDNKVFKITHHIELLLWLVVILVVVSCFSTGFIFHEKNDKNDYQIFIPDADGLIEGSPVRMMGVEVGYITKIVPINDEVYVNFVLTNPDVYVPQGTSVTVEFSGMAGSKSLELYLPEANDYIDESSSIITVNSPKRLHDALGLLNDMMKKIGTITYSISSFGTKLEDRGFELKPATTNKDNIEDFLHYSNKFLDDSSLKAKELRKSIERVKYVGK